MNYTELVESKFAAIVSKYGMLDTTASVLAAFSGGADSSVMLFVLDKECRKRNIRLLALHVNHMIRGKEAERDEEFCKNFAKSRKIEFECVKIDVTAIRAALGIGLEECARNCRYDALNDFCKKRGIDKIATAHNADDNLETIIFNLARGASLSGICGIPPVRENIIRPMLLCSKEEIIGYAKENGIDYIYDSTNGDTKYSRNFIRHKIIPLLKELNSSLTDNVSRFSQTARSDGDYLDKIAEKYLQESDITVLKELEAPILHRVISMKFEQNTKCHLEAKHIDSVADMIKKGHNNSSLSLPQKKRAVIHNYRFVIENNAASEEIQEYFIDLSAGENRISADDSVILILTDESKSNMDILSKQNFYKIFIYTALDFDKIYGKLFARNRRPGDAYRYNGMTRTLKKLLNGKKLPTSERARLPIICDSGGIAWVPGFGVCDRLAPDADTKNICHMYYMKGAIK